MSSDLSSCPPPCPRPSPQAAIFDDTIKQYLATTLKEAIEEHTRELLMPVNK